MSKKDAYINAYLISFLYVGLGTLTVLSVYPADKFSGEWVWVGLLLTFPVNFISFGYRYMEAGSYLPVALIQFCVFVLTGWMIYRGYFKKRVVV
ncbi:hypothetical protein [Chitinophaga sp. S165]|uniref:hypothetical protein n=1 Tax=Chitinophaga sp. S165 TaxID=2135462 RepID=UPI000D716B51|nr:hypothetical protein [Chitinophaga sp. S165]PWV56454.1 hypothetical protein C7475_101970 [Chitinophaga sp. S165]